MGQSVRRFLSAKMKTKDAQEWIGGDGYSRNQPSWQFILDISSRCYYFSRPKNDPKKKKIGITERNLPVFFYYFDTIKG